MIHERFFGRYPYACRANNWHKAEPEVMKTTYTADCRLSIEVAGEASEYRKAKPYLLLRAIKRYGHDHQHIEMFISDLDTLRALARLASEAIQRIESAVDPLEG